MQEHEPQKETIAKGELLFLSHPGTDNIFSGYGLTMQPGSNEFLAGLLMVDRPRPVDPEWLKEVDSTLGYGRDSHSGPEASMMASTLSSRLAG